MFSSFLKKVKESFKNDSKLNALVSCKNRYKKKTLNFLNKFFKSHTYPRNMASVQAWKLFYVYFSHLVVECFWHLLFYTEKTRDILPIKHYIALCFNTAIFKRLNINLWNLKKKSSSSYRLSRSIFWCFSFISSFFSILHSIDFHFSI